MRQQTRQQHSGKFTFTSSYIHTYIYTSLILVNMRVATETFYDFCHHSCCHLLLLQQFTALCIIYMSMTHVLCRQPLALFHTLSLSLSYAYQLTYFMLMGILRNLAHLFV